MTKESLTPKRLKRITVLSVMLNFVLFISKLTLAIFMNSVALISDAFNHFSDALSGFIFWLGHRLSSRKPDANHPQGHGRGEYLTSLTIAVLMLVVAGQFLIESIRRLIDPAPVTMTGWAILVLAVSMFVKLSLFTYLQYLYKKTQLISTKALAVDNLFDVFISFLVLLSLFLQPIFVVSMDGIFGLVIALLMIYSGWKLLRTSVRRVLGETLDPMQKQAVLASLQGYPQVLGTHHFIFHDYGPHYQMLSFHLEVGEEQSFLAMHDLVDEIEENIQKQFGFEVMIHLDPMVTNTIDLAAIIRPMHHKVNDAGLNDYVLEMKAIKEKLHPEIVVVLKNLDKVEEIKSLLTTSFPQHRFVFEA